jgi:hypothetical protein
MDLRESVKTPTSIDVINDDRSAVSQCQPSMVQFIADISFAVQAIMNKEIDLGLLGKNSGKLPSA